MIMFCDEISQEKFSLKYPNKVPGDYDISEIHLISFPLFIKMIQPLKMQ